MLEPGNRRIRDHHQVQEYRCLICGHDFLWAAEDEMDDCPKPKFCPFHGNQFDHAFSFQYKPDLIDYGLEKVRSGEFSSLIEFFEIAGRNLMKNDNGHRRGDTRELTKES